MAAEHWFRWHHGTVTDPKWRIVASRASHALSRTVTVGHALAVWAAMLENASQANPRGTLVNWCDEDIGVALDLDEAEVAAIRKAMQGKTLDDDQVSAWNARQIKRIDETAAERKAAQRSRERHASKNVTKRDTSQSHTASRNVTVETETETETEKREAEEREKPRIDEESSNPPADLLPAPGPSKPKPKPEAKARSGPVTFSQWLKSIPPSSEAIPPNHHVFRYADSVGLPRRFLELEWRWFEDKYTGSRKRYTDWPGVFRKAVEGNWGRLWWIAPDGGYQLTTVGQQLARLAEKAA